VEWEGRRERIREGGGRNEERIKGWRWGGYLENS
jgi:hypothetical protein